MQIINTVCFVFIAISFFIICILKIVEIHLSKLSSDRYNKYLNEKLILDTFLLQIQNPQLNDIFENDENKKDMSPDAVATRRNFLAYVLSVFDFVIDYYYGPKGYSTLDSALKVAWENTILDYFTDSQEIVQVYNSLKKEYNVRFQEYIDNIISKI